MLEEPASAIPPTIWETINSWFTPTVFFVLLNIMIGTIAITSTLTNQNKNHQQTNDVQPQTTNQQQNDPNLQTNKIARSPSLLQRIKSFNLNRSQEPQLHTAQSNRPAQDSDSIFGFEQTHHAPPLELEAHAHYFFQQENFQEKPQMPHSYYFPHNQQENLLETPQIPDSYYFPHTQQENFHENPQMPESYIFSHTHQENPQEITTYLATEQNQEEKPTTFGFEQAHHTQSLEPHGHYFFQQQNFQETPQITQSYIFPLTHQENPQEPMTHMVSEQNQPEKSTTFDFPETHQEEKQDHLDFEEEKATHLDTNFIRTKSATKPASGEVSAKLPARMRKSASMKSAFGHFEEEDIVEARRPATVKEKGNVKVTDDEEVDAKADDFINKFKQQLKLQRVDSVSRYKKEMLGRGTGR